jgi:hypothetical protein
LTAFSQVGLRCLQTVASQAIAQQLEMQDSIAQALSRRRHELGALDFDIAETRVRFERTSAT